MSRLTDLRVAVLATDGVEEVELTQPVKSLKDSGAWVEVISNHARPIQAVNHLEKGSMIPVDRLLGEAKPAEYDALLLPGGAVNADTLRMLPEAREFVRWFQDEGKPMAVICHAAWLLVSADLVHDRRLTSYHTIQDDIRNAGGIWLDREVVEDKNWVTSRQPSDLPAFIGAMNRLFEQSPVLTDR